MDKRARRDVLAIFKAGLAAADPVEAVRRHVVRRGRKLRLGDYSCDLAKVRNIFVVGAGKASARMAGALEEILGDRITGGWINVKAAALPRRNRCGGFMSTRPGIRSRTKPACAARARSSRSSNRPAKATWCCSA